MKKTILVGLMAAMMLFAFTACEGGSAASGYVTKVEATTTKDYVEFGNQDVDPADFTFTGITTSGDTVSISSNQFTLSDKEPVKTGENTYTIYFNWGSTGVEAAASVNVYPVEDMEVAAGTAQVTYYTLTSGTYADPEAQKDSDFNSIKPEGLVLTLTYDTDKTMEYVVDKDTTGVSYAFGKVADNVFTAETNATTVPATAGAYAIQVTVGEFKDTYDVTVETNRVKSTAIQIADNYDLYADGSKAVTLNADKVFVTKTMSNGQVLKAGDTDVKWATTRAGVDEATAQSSVAKLSFSKEPSTFEVFAKFVGGPCETTYTRSVMREVFTSEAVEISDYVVSAYGATLNLLADPDEPYDDSDNKITANDFSGITVTAKYNNGDTDDVEFGEPLADNLRYNIEPVSLSGDEIEGDSVTMTVRIYNGTTLADEVEVIATLVEA